MAHRHFDLAGAYDGEHALALARQHVVEVALLDIGLPRMDGYELARQLRAIPGWERVRLVAVTGISRDRMEPASTAAGFDDHLVKPIDLPALQRTIEKARAPRV